MKVTDVTRVDTPDGGSELSADVSVRHPRPATYRLWFRGPRGCFGEGPHGDVFLAALLVPAMFLHEDLEIEGDISRDLHRAAYERLEPRLLKWHPSYLRAAPLRGARLVDVAAAPAPGVGCMFSGGVDSSFSYLRRLDEITHLVFLGGFELPWKREDLRQGAVEHLRGVADGLDREVVVVTSNLQRLVDDIAAWSVELGRPAPGFLLLFYFGSMLVAFNLCLRGLIGRALIPASWSGGDAVTWGSHPELEPNWSTPGLRVELDGADTARIDKIAWIHRHHPEYLARLRVCTHPPLGGGPINCGACFKCLRTMLEMHAAGVPETAMTAFAAPLDLGRLRRSFFTGDGGLTEQLLQRLRAAGDEDLARALETAMGRRFYLPRLIRGWRLRLHTRRRARRKARHRARRMARALGDLRSQP